MSVPEYQPSRTHSMTFQITVRGRLGCQWSEWFDGLSITFEMDPGGFPITVLTGPVRDQAALRGVLVRLWDLAMDVVSVHQLPSQADGEVGDAVVTEG